MATRKAKAIFDFEGLRKRLGFNQPEMASKMHMSPLTYFSLETEPNAMNQRHIMLAQLVSLQEAVARHSRRRRYGRRAPKCRSREGPPGSGAHEARDYQDFQRAEDETTAEIAIIRFGKPKQ